MSIDLRTCQPGDKLICDGGGVLVYKNIILMNHFINMKYFI